MNTARDMFDLSLPDLGPYAIDYTKNGRFLLLGGRKGHLALMDTLRMDVQMEVRFRRRRVVSGRCWRIYSGTPILFQVCETPLDSRKFSSPTAFASVVRTRLSCPPPPVQIDPFFFPDLTTAAVVHLPQNGRPFCLPFAAFAGATAGDHPRREDSSQRKPGGSGPEEVRLHLRQPGRRGEKSAGVCVSVCVSVSSLPQTALTS